MADESTDPLENVDPESGSLGEEDLADLKAALHSDSPIERREGARFSAMIAAKNSEAILPLLEDLIPLLEADRVSIAQHAGSALTTVTTDHIEEALDAVPEMVTMATHDLNGPRVLGANMLATVAVNHPEALADDVGRLLPVLHEETGPYEPSPAVTEVENPDTRLSVAEQEQGEHQKKLESLGTIANVVVAVAEEVPGALADDVDELATLVDHDDGTIAGCAIDAIAEVAQDDTAAAAPAVEVLIDTLDRDDERLQARAIRALGFIEDDRAVEPLRDLAAESDEEDVAELAAKTADFLADA